MFDSNLGLAALVVAGLVWAIWSISAYAMLWRASKTLEAVEALLEARENVREFFPPPSGGSTPRPHAH